MNRILVVEGQNSERQGLVSTLSQAGYEVLACADVVNGARAIGQIDFDLVAVNTMVKSGRDGVAFIRFIYQQCNGLIPPVLVISRERRETVGAIPGVVDFLTTPYDGDTLIECVSRILGDREKISPHDLQVQLKLMLNGSLQLPTLPEIRLEVLKLTADLHERDPYKEAAVAEVAKVVSKDPPLCGLLIAQANRVPVRGKQEVKTALVAVSRLGLKQVHSLAVATSVLEVARLSNKMPGFDPKKLWVHSVACAANAQVLSSHLGLDSNSRELVFTASIMHDLGKIAVCNFFPDFLAAVLRLMRSKRCSMVEAEQEIGGITHATVGALLAQRWPLPQVLAAVIASHHLSSTRGGGELGRITSIVQVADAVSYHQGMGFGLVRVVPAINPDALRSLALGLEQVEDLKLAMLARARELLADLPFKVE